MCMCVGCRFVVVFWRHLAAGDDAPHTPTIIHVSNEKYFFSASVDTSYTFIYDSLAHSQNLTLFTVFTDQHNLTFNKIHYI